jgi:hypothetical protein
MEMSLLETVRLLGLDIQLAVVAILLVLQLLERAAGSAWTTLRSARSDRPQAQRTRLSVGTARHA